MTRHDIVTFRALFERAWPYNLDGYQKGYQAGWHDGRREATLEPALNVRAVTDALVALTAAYHHERAPGCPARCPTSGARAAGERKNAPHLGETLNLRYQPIRREVGEAPGGNIVQFGIVECENGNDNQKSWCEPSVLPAIVMAYQGCFLAGGVV